MDSESGQIKSAYATFGLAFYYAQCVERQLSILLATKYGPGITDLTSEQYDKLLDKLFDKTFGGLVKHLRETVGIPEEFEVTLAEAVDKRNWLAHHYFWERAGHFVTEEGRLFMVTELEKATDFFIAFEKQLDSIIKQYANQHGITERIVASEEQQLRVEADEHMNES